MAVVTAQATYEDISVGSIWWGAGSASRFWIDVEQDVMAIFVSSEMLVRYSQNLRIGLQRLVRSVIKTDEHIQSLIAIKPSLLSGLEDGGGTSSQYLGHGASDAKTRN